VVSAGCEPASADASAESDDTRRLERGVAAGVPELTERVFAPAPDDVSGREQAAMAPATGHLEHAAEDASEAGFEGRGGAEAELPAAVGPPTKEEIARADETAVRFAGTEIQGPQAKR